MRFYRGHKRLFSTLIMHTHTDTNTSGFEVHERNVEKQIPKIPPKSTLDLCQTFAKNCTTTRASLSRQLVRGEERLEEREQRKNERRSSGHSKTLQNSSVVYILTSPTTWLQPKTCQLPLSVIPLINLFLCFLSIPNKSTERMLTTLLWTEMGRKRGQ